ncbi:ibr domain containing protein [Stylonychia lemnae]|uniref:Ibr domain containing protein n=1 Tax=Stylonychia lemnae TaxID=5949 RepID=A0A077ZPH6_STYLE|nr:ibr domain containing protein [Stylonychia lemnae]|eukprot:CDW71877.1 ibr domain containing protein [Stylonychia lemnae]
MMMTILVQILILEELLSFARDDVCQLRCLDNNCLANLPASLIKDLSSEDENQELDRLWDQYKKSLQKHQKICLTENCCYILEKKLFSSRVECQYCQIEYCFDCNVVWHYDMTCKQYQKQLLSWVIGKDIQKCPKCAKLVEKTIGQTLQTLFQLGLLVRLYCIMKPCKSTKLEKLKQQLSFYQLSPIQYAYFFLYAVVQYLDLFI